MADWFEELKQEDLCDMGTDDIRRLISELEKLRGELRECEKELDEILTFYGSEMTAIRTKKIAARIQQIRKVVGE